MQHRAAAFDKMKIGPEDCIIQGGLQDGKSNYDDLYQKKTAILSLFLKVPNG